MNLSSLSSRRILDQAILLSLILLAAWLRFWRLDSIPPGLWFDEAYYAMDAVWLRQTHTWPVFLLGNNGREAMFSYLLSLSTLVWGETAYAARLVPAFVGTLSIPLIYRWGLTLFKNDAAAPGLALVSAAGLATSFWYVSMNRSGYRANLLPLFVLIVSYFFWRGWQTGQLRYYLLAGVGLGLSQYTYLSARLLPLVFILFVLIQALPNLLGLKDLTGFREFLRKTWLQLLLMAGTSALVAVPLFLFFLDYPEAFWGRVSDVAIKPGWSGEQLKLLGLHLWSAGRVFIDGEDPNWRHHLLGRPVFDGFSAGGFWLGLIIAVRRYHRPEYLFLVLWLVVMWLPAPLSEPAFHTLRLSGLLPAYYVLMAVGLINAINWIAALIARMSPLGSSKVRAPRESVPRGPSALTPERRSQTGSEQYASRLTPLLTLSIPLLLSGSLTFYDYFYHWAEAPEVYQAYEGPVVELADYLAMPQTNLIIPFYLYTHASIRYLLNNDYREDVFLPADVATALRQQEKVSIIIPTNPPDDNLPPAFVWLIKAGPQAGAAYVSAVRRDFSLAELKAELLGSITGSRGTIIAQRYQVDTEAVLSLFPSQKPSKAIAFDWADNLRLTGYEFAPASIKPDMSGSLFLSWQILGYTGLDAKMFSQMLDSQGNPLGQDEVAPLSRKMYRWRDDGLILEENPLDFASGLKPGLYFVRLGFFNPKTSQRLPVHNPSGQLLGDQVILGPLYVHDDKIDPTRPQYPVEARLGDAIEILGYSLTPVPAATPSTEVTLYWQTRAPIERDYTAFVQLLDGHNQLIAQQDHQPLNGLYPTSRWRSGDIMADKFVLPVLAEQLSAPNQLVTGMYDLATGARLPAFGPDDQAWPDDLIHLNRGLLTP